MSSIFSIVADLREAYEMAESGDYSPEAVADTIEAIEWTLAEKADSYVGLISEIKGEMSVIDNEIVRLENLKKSKNNFIDSLKLNLYNAMLLSESPKFKTPLHSYWIQNNPPALSLTDESQIPSEYYITPPPILDKARLKKDLMDGAAVSGAEITQGERVGWR